LDTAGTLFFITAGTASLCFSRASPSSTATATSTHTVGGRGSQVAAGARGNNKARGKTQLVELAELAPGAFFGEGCVLSSSAQCASVRGIRTPEAPNIDNSCVPARCRPAVALPL